MAIKVLVQLKNGKKKIISAVSDEQYEKLFRWLDNPLSNVLDYDILPNKGLG